MIMAKRNELRFEVVNNEEKFVTYEYETAKDFIDAMAGNKDDVDVPEMDDLIVSGEYKGNRKYIPSFYTVEILHDKLIGEMEMESEVLQ